MSIKVIYLALPLFDRVLWHFIPKSASVDRGNDVPSAWAESGSNLEVFTDKCRNCSATKNYQSVYLYY